jgi:hypothetical protein
MEPLEHPRTADPACRVRVTERDGQLALVAAVDVAAGGAILYLDGEIYRRPTRYSVQVGVGRHVDAPHDVDPKGQANRYVWRFLNHACSPNAVLHERTLVANRAIRAGEQVTFDYESNEWDMADPFACGCGAVDCRGFIRGFRHLDDQVRRRVLPLASSHVLSMLQQA